MKRFRFAMVLLSCGLFLSGCAERESAPPKAAPSETTPSESAATEPTSELPSLVETAKADSMAMEEAAAPSEPQLIETSPREVLERFYRAMVDYDAEEAIACTVEDPLASALVKSQASLFRAFKQLGDNCVEYFGDEGKQMQLPNPVLLMLDKLEETEIEISGSTATFPINPKSPMNLVLVDGQWKIDLASSYPSEDMLRFSINTLQSIEAYVSEVAQEVLDGKYETIPEVQKEMKRRGENMGNNN